MNQKITFNVTQNTRQKPKNIYYLDQKLLSMQVVYAPGKIIIVTFYELFHFISYQLIDKIYFTIVTLDLRQHIFEQKLEAHDSLPSMRAKICLNIFPHNEKPIEVASNCEIDLI